MTSQADRLEKIYEELGLSYSEAKKEYHLYSRDVGQGESSNVGATMLLADAIITGLKRHSDALRNAAEASERYARSLSNCNVGFVRRHDFIGDNHIPGLILIDFPKILYPLFTST